MSGKWTMESGQWRVESGQWRVDNSQLSTVNCQLKKSTDIMVLFSRFHNADEQF